jgi:hypothetical protein
MAVAQLRGFRSHVRTPITQAIVDEYRWIIKALEEATGEYLQQFSIPSASMEARPLPELRRARGFARWYPSLPKRNTATRNFSRPISVAFVIVTFIGYWIYQDVHRFSRLVCKAERRPCFGCVRIRNEPKLFFHFMGRQANVFGK